MLRIGDSPASILDQLGTGGEPLALGYILPYAFDTRRAVARAAARAVASILNRVPISELPWLDEQLAMRSSVGLDKLLPTTSPSGSSIHAKSVGR